MNELIEKLKNNKVAFGLLGQDERECLDNVNGRNCVFYGTDNQWHDKTPGKFLSTYTYRIKPDYKPELEYIDCHVVNHKGILGIWSRDGVRFENWKFIHLHCLPSLPNFHCFWKESYGRPGYMSCNAFWNTSIVASRRKTHNVYARFRTGGGH